MLKYYRFVLWVLVIAVLCFSPGNEFREVNINIPHLDKLIHFIMFFILGLLIKGVEGIKERIYYVLLGFGIIYAGVIELIQYYYIYMRSGDVFDFAADCLGLFFGVISFSIIPKFLRRFLN